MIIKYSTSYIKQILCKLQITYFVFRHNIAGLQFPLILKKTLTLVLLYFGLFILSIYIIDLLASEINNQTY